MGLINQLNVVSKPQQQPSGATDPFASFVYEGSEVIPQSNVSPDFDIASTSWFLVYNAEYTGHEVIIQSETAPDFEIASTSWSTLGS